MANVLDNLYSLPVETCGCPLIVHEDTGTTTSVKLSRVGNVPLAAEIDLSAGLEPVFKWQVLHITCAGGTFNVEGATLKSAGYYVVNGGGAVEITAVNSGV